MLNFKDLTREQKQQLKANYCACLDYQLSWNELANIDDVVSDEQIESAYGDIGFVSEDFF